MYWDIMLLHLFLVRCRKVLLNPRLLQLTRFLLLHVAEKVVVCFAKHIYQYLFNAVAYEATPVCEGFWCRASMPRSSGKINST